MVQSTVETLNSQYLMWDEMKTCLKCGKEAEDKYFVKNRKECKECKSKYMKGRYKNIKEKAAKYGKVRYENNKEEILKKNKEYRNSNKEKIKLLNREYRDKNKEKIKNYRIALSSFEDHVGKLSPSDKPKMLKGFVSVICKKCGERFHPTNTQIGERLRVYLDNDGSNFYCSDNCKNNCYVFNFKPALMVDPRLKPDTKSVNKARKCQTNHLKQLQCDEKGHNYCEKCGDIIDVELHHTLPVAEFGEEAINSATHILLCAGCHVGLKC